MFPVWDEDCCVYSCVDSDVAHVCVHGSICDESCHTSDFVDAKGFDDFLEIPCASKEKETCYYGEHCICCSASVVRDWTEVDGEPVVTGTQGTSAPDFVKHEKPKFSTREVTCHARRFEDDRPLDALNASVTSWDEGSIDEMEIVTVFHASPPPE